MNTAFELHKKIERYISEYNHYVTGKLQASGKELPKDKFIDALPYLIANNSSSIFRVKHFKYIGVSNIGNAAAEQKQYASTNADRRIFLVIPSFFNSSSILHFDQQNNFVKILQEHGEVFLFHWLETSRSYIMEDVVNAIEAYIRDNFAGRKIDIVGHCIGGVIAAGVINKLGPKGAFISSLTLLTCSWNFDHFKNYLDLMDCLELDKQVKSLKFIPKMFIQIMFFMLNPQQFNYKIDKYFASCKESRKRVLEIEYWLQSGISLPTSLYIDLMENLIKKNISSNGISRNDGMLRLGAKLIDPGEFDMPVFISYCQNDLIVPKNSVEPLIDAVNAVNSSKTVIELPGGHISYLVSNIAAIKSPYDRWIKEL